MKRIKTFILVFIVIFATNCIFVVDAGETWVSYDNIFSDYNAKRVDLNPTRSNHHAIQVPITLNSELRNYSLFISYEVKQVRVTTNPNDKRIRVYVFTVQDYQNWRNSGEVSNNALYNANAIYKDSDTFSVDIFSSDTYIIVFSNENSIIAIMDTEITVRQRYERFE